MNGRGVVRSPKAGVTHARRLLGNFPQAFSHIGLVNAAYNLMQAAAPARQRAGREPQPRSPQPRS